MNQQQLYSDSEDCRFSEDFENQEGKKSTSLSRKNKNPSNQLYSNHLVKQSGLQGIPLQKNKYANKIKSISNQIEYKGTSQTNLKKIQSNLSSSLLNNLTSNQQDGNSSINQPDNNKSSSFLDKKQRNKQSAKLSRDRKKLYIEMLEEKQKTLNKKLLSKKKELQETKNYLDRVVNQNKAMSGFTASRHQMIKNLQTVLQSKDISLTERNNQINKIIDNLRYRIGAAGKQRINTINQYFRQIVNLSLPALHRYMMWSATQQKHLFSEKEDEQTDEWYKELKSSLNLTEQQKKQVQSKKQFLQSQKKVLEKLIGRLKNVKGQIQQKSIQLEDLIDQIRSVLTPIQCAHFVLFIQKNKYRKQLNLCDQLEQDNKQKGRQSDDSQDMGPRKYVKRQLNS